VAGGGSDRLSSKLNPDRLCTEVKKNKGTVPPHLSKSCKIFQVRTELKTFSFFLSILISTCILSKPIIKLINIDK